MKTLMVLAAAVLSAVAFADEPATRQAGPRGPFGGQQGRFAGMGAGMGADSILRIATNPMLAEKIGLSDEQKAKIKEVAGDSSQMRDLQKKIRDGMKRQAELLNGATIDEAAVMSAIDEVFEARKVIAKNQTRQLIAVRSILTPEQIEKAKNSAKEIRNRRGKGPRENGPRGGKRESKTDND